MNGFELLRNPTGAGVSPPHPQGIFKPKRSGFSGQKGGKPCLIGWIEQIDTQFRLDPIISHTFAFGVKAARHF